MVERRHKGHTRTFDDLNFSKQAKSISAQLVNLGRAIRHHVTRDKATARTRADLSGQVRRFTEAMTTALELSRSRHGI
jgi:hypothetical protein